MVVEEAVGDGNEVSRMCYVEKTIIIILVMVEIRREVDVVDPDVGGLFCGGLGLAS